MAANVLMKISVIKKWEQGGWVEARKESEQETREDWLRKKNIRRNSEGTPGNRRKRSGLLEERGKKKEFKTTLLE